MTDYVPWLRGLAQKGGKGAVDNIDARSLGRVADQIEGLRSDFAALQAALVGKSGLSAIMEAQKLRALHPLGTALDEFVNEQLTPGETK